MPRDKTTCMLKVELKTGWQLYGGTVPFMSLINGHHHTRFAGAWSILSEFDCGDLNVCQRRQLVTFAWWAADMHEIAVVSGFAAAYKLGAECVHRRQMKLQRAPSPQPNPLQLSICFQRRCQAVVCSLSGAFSRITDGERCRPRFE